jgi:DNA mismatch repair protein MutS
LKRSEVFFPIRLLARRLPPPISSHAVKALHPDEMSPREALDALYALKAKLPKQ